MLLAEQWSALQQHGFLQEQTDQFRRRLHFEVGKYYPWLTAELFALEGEMGWGPGFREYAVEFFPPMLPEAPGRMAKFLELLWMICTDDILTMSLEDAQKGVTDTSVKRMLATALKAKIKNRNDVIRMVYGKIAFMHSPYTMGGARIYLALWTLQERYSLAIAGLIWLLHAPLVPLRVRAETVKKKLLWQQRAGDSSSFRSQYSIVYPQPPVSSGTVQALQGVN